MRLLRQRVVTQQPQQGFAIDWSNPITKGLQYVLIANSLFEVSSGKALTQVGTRSLLQTKEGLALIGNNLQLAYMAIPNTVFSGDITVVGLVPPTPGSATGTANVPFGLGHSGGNAYFGFQSSSANGGSSFTARQTNSGGVTNRLFGNNVSAVPNRPVVVAGTLVGNSSIDVYWEGVLDNGTLSTGSSGSNAYDRIAIGGIQRSTSLPAQSGANAIIALFYNRALTPAEHYSIGKNIWQVIRPSAQTRYAVISTGLSHVTSDLGSTYNVKNSIQSDQAASYNIRSSLQSDRAASYNIKNAITSDRAASYNVKNAIQSSLSATYSVGNIVQSDQSASYNIKNAVQSDRAASYNIKNSLQSDRSASYNVKNSLQSSLSASYSIGAALAIVSPADRGTLDLSQCSITPNGSTPTFNLKNKRYVADDNTTGPRFTFFKVTGVNGMTPLFSVARTGMDLASDNKWLWSYTGDLDDWHTFDNITNGTTTTFWVSSNNSAFTQDTVYVSQNFPWPAGYTLPWLNALMTAYPTRIGYAASGSGSFQFNTRTATTDGNSAVAAQPMYSAKVSSGSGNAPDGYQKRKMVLISGVHASEDVGNYALRGAVEFLVGGSSQAETVLSWFDVYIYPLVAAAGRPGGALRADFEATHMTYDVNRHWRDTSMETIVKHKAAIATDAGSTVTVFMDFHGQHYGSDTHVDNIQASTSDVTLWQNAIRVYWPTMPMNTGVVDPSISTNYAKLDLACRFALNPEHQYWTTETNTQVIGQYHIQAVADLATAGTFAMPSVQSDLASAYNVKTSIQADRAASYNVRSSVQSDRAASYVIKTAIQSDRSASYSIKNAIQSDRSASYSIKNAIQSDRSASYNIRTSIQSSSAASYNIKAAIQSDRFVSYGIGGAFSSIQSDRAASYNIRNTVQSSLTPSYAIRTSLQSDRPVTYNIRQTVISSFGVTYICRVSVGANLIPSYTLRNALHRDLVSSYGVGVSNVHLPLPPIVIVNRKTIVLKANR